MNEILAALIITCGNLELSNKGKQECITRIQECYIAYYDSASMTVSGVKFLKFCAKEVK